MDAVAQRLKAASEQLGRELAHEGGLPDGVWEIEIQAGAVTVRHRTVEKPLHAKINTETLAGDPSKK